MEAKYYTNHTANKPTTNDWSRTTKYKYKIGLKLLFPHKSVNFDNYMLIKM